VAEAEHDTELQHAVVQLAAAIASQWTRFVGTEPGKQWRILPLLLDPTDTQEMPEYPRNAQGQGLGNAALGLQVVDSAKLGLILLRGMQHTDESKRALSLSWDLWCG
jgi:hypothetical protein